LLSGRRKLLLADDSPTIQKVISLTFGDEGIEVVAVSNGTQALRVLEDEQPPDILLADVLMPGPDGYELCERVKRDERLRHVPVILLVGTFEPFNEAEARRVGADTVLTKPFQSIRDLVSKVGSLLGGGGEPKQDETAAHEPPRQRAATASAEATSESSDFSADAPAQAQRATPASAMFDEHVNSSHADPASSFADLGADDELIEAKPADAFGASSRMEEVMTNTEEETANQTGQMLTNQSEEMVTNQTEESGINEERMIHEESAMHEQPSFDARATSAAAADDALLDLGQAEPHATGHNTDADDFVLDLDFEDELSLPSVPAYEGQAAGASANVMADAPSAFAEAAHGEQSRPFMQAAQHFAEPTPHFDEQSQTFVEHIPSATEHADSFNESAASSFDESAASFAQVEFSTAPSAEGHDDAVAEVFMQDGPQGFASYTEPQSSDFAPRSFVEPEVVPADEPVQAVVVDEFMDGSVEGDVPRAPAGFDTTPIVEATAVAAPEMAAPSMDASETVAPSESSTVSHNVGEARSGLEESPRADQLSREMIDAIARRVVELMSDNVVREVAWEVVPELAELLIKQKLDEKS
jgi:CheY-like chemotaxis protein